MFKKSLIVISIMLILGYVFIDEISIYAIQGVEYISHFIDDNIQLKKYIPEELEIDIDFSEENEEDEENEKDEIEIIISDKKYYYYQLSELEQELYKEVVSTYLNYETEIQLEGAYENMNRDDVYKVHQYVLLDYPEIFWLDEQSSIAYIEKNDAEYLTSLNATMQYTIDEIVYIQDELENKVEEVALYISEASTSYEKALGVYEYIIQNCQYDSESANIVISSGEYNEEVKDSISIIGCLINGKAVCSGYSKAYTYLLEQVGVQAISVMGYADGIGHEWNMVLLDGSYYNVDCTWGDPVSETNEEDSISYYYFGVTSEKMSTTHMEMEDVIYPECTETKYNYYTYNGLCFEIYSYEVINQIFVEGIEENREEIIFSFTTYEEYETALTALLETDLSKICQPYSEQLENQCSYATVEDLYLITIKLVYKTE